MGAETMVAEREWRQVVTAGIGRFPEFAAN
jgi:hypothetical protein